MEETDYHGTWFASQDPNEFMGDNVYITKTDKNKVFIIGKYDDRNYLDEDEYYSDENYFFTFGDLKNKKIINIHTIRENRITLNQIEFLYDKVLEKVLNLSNVNKKDIKDMFF